MKIDKFRVDREYRKEGVDPLTAIQMATINVARYFKLEQDVGAIAPGKCADILIIEDLQKVEPVTVLADGEVMFDNGKLVTDITSYTYPGYVRNSMNVKAELSAADFLLESKSGKSETEVHVIKIIENSARTEKMTAVLKVQDGVIHPDVGRDIIQLACVDRHHGSGQISLGFAHGFQLHKGAVASTVAHDSHNLLVMGTSREDMAFAANELVKCGGGMIAVESGEVLARVVMPIAGLMSDQPLETVVEQVRQLENAWKELGCPLNAPFMTFSLIALAVIPEIRITNRGIADVTQFKLIETEID